MADHANGDGPSGELHSAEEDRLVAQAVEGDTEAFGQLYELYLDRIYRYAYFRIGSRADAEDVTELTFLKAWEALPGFVPRGGGFRAWLFRVAHNAIVDHFRARPPVQPLPDDPTGADGPFAMADTWTDRELDLDALHAAMRQLSDDERTIILLRFVEGLPHRAVARLLDRSEQASRVLQYRALRKLQDLLQPHYA